MEYAKIDVNGMLSVQLKEHKSKPLSKVNLDHKWRQSLRDLDSQPSEYGGKISEQVYVSKQREKIDETTKTKRSAESKSSNSRRP
ncbi:unnamed protein product, partial [Aphanomyces euteiches]